MIMNLETKNTPSSRSRTSDLRIIVIHQLQSSALPTELSKEAIQEEEKNSLY